MSRERFTEVFEEVLTRFSSDLKIILRLSEDPNFDDESRIALAGALLHLLTGVSVIPGVRGVLKLLGDSVVLRLILKETSKRSPDTFATHRKDFPELLDVYEDHLAAASDYLGERMSVFEKSAADVGKLTYRGHAAKACAEDRDEFDWLYDAIIAALVDQFDIEDDEITREMKQVDRILAPLASRIPK